MANIFGGDTQRPLGRRPRRSLPLAPVTVPLSLAVDAEDNPPSTHKPFSDEIDALLRRASDFRRQQTKQNIAYRNLQGEQDELELRLSPSRLMMGQAIQDYGTAEEMSAETDRFVRMTHQLREQQAEGQRKKDLEQLVEDFSPPTVSDVRLPILQLLSGRSDIPSMQSTDYARRLEGIERAKEFGRSVAGLDPDKRAELGALNLALIKEGLTAGQFTDVVEVMKTRDPEQIRKVGSDTVGKVMRALSIAPLKERFPEAPSPPARRSAASFLLAGRATHPDEGEVQAEYDTMLGALSTGQDLDEAVRLATSHQQAHQNALLPEVMGTVRDPFPGQPEKNQEAAEGFGRLLNIYEQQRRAGLPGDITPPATRAAIEGIPSPEELIQTVGPGAFQPPKPTTGFGFPQPLPAIAGFVGGGLEDFTEHVSVPIAAMIWQAATTLPYKKGGLARPKAIDDPESIEEYKEEAPLGIRVILESIDPTILLPGVGIGEGGVRAVLLALRKSPGLAPRIASRFVLSRSARGLRGPLTEGIEAAAKKILAESAEEVVPKATLPTIEELIETPVTAARVYETERAGAAAIERAVTAAPETGRAVPEGVVVQEVAVEPGARAQGRRVWQAVDESGTEVGRMEVRETATNIHLSDINAPGFGRPMVRKLLQEANERGLGITADLNSGAMAKRLAEDAPEGKFFDRVGGSVITPAEAVQRADSRLGPVFELPPMAGGAETPLADIGDAVARRMGLQTVEQAQDEVARTAKALQEFEEAGIPVARPAEEAKVAGLEAEVKRAAAGEGPQATALREAIERQTTLLSDLEATRVPKTGTKAALKRAARIERVRARLRELKAGVGGTAEGDIQRTAERLVRADQELADARFAGNAAEIRRLTRARNLAQRAATRVAKAVSELPTTAARAEDLLVQQERAISMLPGHELHTLRLDAERAVKQGQDRLAQMRESLAEAKLGGNKNAIARAQVNVGRAEKDLLKLQLDAPRTKLIQGLEGAVRLKPEQRAIQHELLQAAAARAELAIEKSMRKVFRAPGEILAGIRAEMRGKRALPIINPLRGRFTPEEIVDLENQLARHYQKLPFKVGNAIGVLHDLLDGYPPTPHQAKLLSVVFGPKFSKALDAATTTLPERVWREMFQVINLQRVLQSSGGDISPILRQAVLAITFPGQYFPYVGKTVRMWFDGEYSAVVASGMVSDPRYARYQKMGLSIGAAEEYAGLGAAREIAEPIEERLLTPGEGVLAKALEGQFGAHQFPSPVRASGRSFSLGLAKLRFDLMSQFDAAMKSRGYTDDAIGSMAHLVNAMTGRGTLGQAERWAPMLNQVLYSARLQAARIQIPGYLFNKSPYVRLIAARSLLGTLGLMGSVLGLLKLSGQDIEMDPRSADWGKVKVGPTRIDITGGFGPLIRFAIRTSSQIAFGEGLKDPLGELQDFGFRDGVTSFLESKLAPAASLGADVFIKGETFTGEPLTASWETVRREALNRATPFFVQSLVEAIQVGGWPAAPFAAAELIGFGVQTYIPFAIEIKQAIDDDIQQGIIDMDDYAELGGRGPQRLGELTGPDLAGFKERNADLAKRIAERGDEALGEVSERTIRAVTGRESQIISERASESMEAAAQIYREDGDGEKFRKSSDDILKGMRGARASLTELLDEVGLPGDERPTVPSTAQDLFDYFAVFDKYPDADWNSESAQKMFDDQDVFLDSLGSTRAAKVEERLGVSLKSIPEYAQLRGDRHALREAGFFDRSERVWDDMQARYKALAKYDSLDAYTRAKIDSLTPDKGVNQATVAVRRDPIVLRTGRLMKDALNEWRDNNPDLLDVAVQWGYLDLRREDVGLDTPGGLGGLGGLEGLGGLGSSTELSLDIP